MDATNDRPLPFNSILSLDIDLHFAVAEYGNLLYKIYDADIKPSLAKKKSNLMEM